MGARFGSAGRGSVEDPEDEPGPGFGVKVGGLGGHRPTAVGHLDDLFEAGGSEQEPHSSGIAGHRRPDVVRAVLEAHLIEAALPR